MALVRPVQVIPLLFTAFCSFSQAQSIRSSSNCDGRGPYALRINEDLLREDVRGEAMEAPPLSRTDRKPGQQRQALRGVCQDPRTGKTIPEHELDLPALDLLPAEDGVTGGDEGSDPSPGVERAKHLPSPKSVIGSDQRVLQSPTTSFPFRAVVKLFMTFQVDPTLPKKKIFECTGSMISSIHVLTAGHCIFKQQGVNPSPNIFGWADSVVVVPGLDSFTKPFGQTSVTKPLRSFKAWTKDADVEGDIALITLNQPFSVGSFGLAYPSDNTLDGALVAYIIGYPGDMGSPLGRQQAFVPGGGGITDYDSELVFYQIDTNNGQSGAGVYSFFSGKRAIITVHHGPCAQENCGARINSSKHAIIRGWQCADGVSIPNVCP
jgi:V8-like Glu-specific endopeptidase